MGNVECVSSCKVLRLQDLVISQNPQYTPQYTIILVMGTPKKGTPNFGKPPFRGCRASRFPLKVFWVGPRVLGFGI